MAYHLILQPLAIRALDNIYDWGVQDSGKRAAARFVSKIMDKIRDLKKSPLSCPVEQMLEGAYYEYRSLVAHPYFKVIFRIDDIKHEIVIADIWDTRMDPDDLQSHINRKLK